MVKMNESYTTFFGPADIPTMRTDGGEDEMEIKEKVERRIMKKRIMKKMKKIRQSFSNAVTSGRRSGSVKIVLEHYDTLICSLVQPQLSH